MIREVSEVSENVSVVNYMEKCISTRRYISMVQSISTFSLKFSSRNCSNPGETFVSRPSNNSIQAKNGHTANVYSLFYSV